VVAIILATPYLISFVLPLLMGDHAPNGVSIQGQPVGGMGRTEIRTLLDQRYSTFQNQPLTLVFEGRTWQPNLSDLGVQVDLERTIDQALAAGARGNPIQRIEAWWRLWQGGQDIAPIVQVDTIKLQSYLLTIAPELEQPPRDAALSLTAGKVLPTGALQGRQLLIDQTTIEILRAIQTLDPQDVALRTRTLAPRIDDANAAAAIDEARVLLKNPLRLRQSGRDWTWDQERIASMVVIQPKDGRLVAEIDPERLARQIEKLAQLVDSGSSEPRLTFQNGKVQISEAGHIGLRLKQSEAADAIIIALRSDLHTVELPIENVNPQVTETTLPALGITELVTEGRSSFAGSAPYRVTNIKAGAHRMNGVLIPPDAEFSFNTQLGDVDEKSGFVQGYAVIGNRTQLEWGGGVCQVSTTVFRAAFWAGVPITERHAHPFYISWYDDYSFPDQAGPGMDATIFTGVQDFKFVNDTGKWLLMESTVDEQDQVLSIKMYGTRPDRTVQVIGPEISNEIPPPDQPVYITDPALPPGSVKQTDRARKGMDITVYRVIEQGGTKQPPELFFTRFKSWPNVFVRGIGSP
jgi:vancomycin resistance protein YoaR